MRVYNVALSPGQIQADMVTAIGGSSPALSLSTSTVAFGNQTVGTPTAPSLVTVTNGGNRTEHRESSRSPGRRRQTSPRRTTALARSRRLRAAPSNVTFTPDERWTAKRLDYHRQ